jgi:hypothetical protein
MDPDEAWGGAIYKFQLHTAHKDNNKDIAGARVQQAGASPVGKVEDRALEVSLFTGMEEYRLKVIGIWMLLELEECQRKGNGQSTVHQELQLAPKPRYQARSFTAR